MRLPSRIIRAYQVIVSPALHLLLGPGNGCRFTPSCSAYAREAFDHRPFHIALGLTLVRILRCNPWSSGGYDPLPHAIANPLPPPKKA